LCPGGLAQEFASSLIRPGRARLPCSVMSVRPEFDGFTLFPDLSAFAGASTESLLASIPN
jgi:hypothetical protein